MEPYKTLTRSPSQVPFLARFFGGPSSPKVDRRKIGHQLLLTLEDPKDPPKPTACLEVRQREPYASLGSVEPVQNCGGLCVQATRGSKREKHPGTDPHHVLSVFFFWGGGSFGVRLGWLSKSWDVFPFQSYL